MVIVMGIMSIVMIISTFVISLFTNNLKLAKHQELKTQAYYLALSGVDLGMSSLLKLDAEDNRLLDVFDGILLQIRIWRMTLQTNRSLLTCSL